MQTRPSVTAVSNSAPCRSPFLQLYHPIREVMACCCVMKSAQHVVMDVSTNRDCHRCHPSLLLIPCCFRNCFSPSPLPPAPSPTPGKFRRAGERTPTCDVACVSAGVTGTRAEDEAARGVEEKELSRATLPAPATPCVL